MAKFLVAVVLSFLVILFENCYAEFDCPAEQCKLPFCKKESDCKENQQLVPTLCKCCKLCAEINGEEGDTCGYGTCQKGLECIYYQCTKPDSDEYIPNNDICNEESESDSDSSDSSDSSENNKSFSFSFAD